MITLSGPAAQYLAVNQLNGNYSLALTSKPPSAATLALTVTETTGGYSNSPRSNTFNISFVSPLLETVEVPPERLAVVQITPVASSSVGLHTSMPSIWRAPLSPFETADYAVDFSSIVGNRVIDKIESITVSDQAAALGLMVVAAGDRSPVIDRPNNRVLLWLTCEPSLVNAGAFDNGGILLGVTVRISTVGSPSAVFDRTVAVNVRRL